jgi:hypothetical protein
MCTDPQRTYPPRVADLHEPGSLVAGLPTLPADLVTRRAKQAADALQQQIAGVMV